MKKLFWTFPLIALVGCSVTPTVPFYDRHTVLEAEAAGDWPNFEARLFQDSVKRGPTFLEKDESQTRRRRAMNGLQGEMLPGKQKRSSQ